MRKILGLQRNKLQFDSCLSSCWRRPSKSSIKCCGIMRANQQKTKVSKFWLVENPNLCRGRPECPIETTLIPSMNVVQVKSSNHKWTHFVQRERFLSLPFYCWAHCAAPPSSSSSSTQPPPARGSPELAPNYYVRKFPKIALAQNLHLRYQHQNQTLLHQPQWPQWQALV